MSASIVKSIFKNANKCVFNVRCMGTYKTSTGLVGLAVQPDGNNVLLEVTKNALDSIKRVPADAEYRIQIERTLNFITKTCNEKGSDIRAIENEIDLGQIEEVIEMVKDEMESIDNYVDNKIWEAVSEAHKDADDVIASMGDVIYFTDPKNKQGKPAQ